MKMKVAAIPALGLIAFALLGSSGGEEDIYYPSQAAADAELTQFDGKHADCQLWTNWQKLCSRTGPNGQTSCRTSAQRGIRPSAPFCVAREDGGYRRPDESDGDRALRSSLRFCTYPAGKPATSIGQAESCEYSPSRPFGGHELRNQTHPWCVTWKEAAPVRDASFTRRPRYGFYCAARKIPSWCEWADGLGYGPDLTKKPSGAQNERIPILINPDSIAVRGVFCRRRTK